MLVAVILLLICPERRFDRTALFHRKADRFVPQFLFVVHAVFLLRNNHLDSVDLLLQQEVLLTDQLVREIHEGVLVEVCVQLPSWLSHLREKPEVRHYFLVSSEVVSVAVRRRHVTAASLDREGAIQMNSDLSCLLWFLLLLLLLFREGKDMRERFCRHRYVCEPFFKTFKVRLSRELRWMDVVSTLRFERVD